MQSKPGTCNLELQLDEKSWYAFNAGTQVGLEGAVTAEATGKLRNLTGNAEQHSITISHGRPTIYDQETELTYRLRFPRIFGKPLHAQWALYQQFQNAQADSSFTERQRGAGLDFIRCGSFTLSSVVCAIRSRNWHLWHRTCSILTPH